MNYKRLTLLSGHYGSGKTNIAVNMAFDLKKAHAKVAIADIDIVNPYFRTKDSEDELEAAGIRLICSKYANSNLDIPALPQEVYALTDDRSITAVFDIGGDDRGALAMGRYVPAIKEENNYDFLLVVNCYRPLTPDAASAAEIMAEIETACKLSFTGIVNNSNLGRETTVEDILSSVKFAEEVSALTKLPLKLTTVEQRFFEPLKNRIPNLFPLVLQKKTI